MNFKYDSSYASEHRPPNSSPGNDRVPGSVSLETFPLYRETKTEREREGGGSSRLSATSFFPSGLLFQWDSARVGRAIFWTESKEVY